MTAPPGGDHDEMVELTRVAFIVEAVAIRQNLESAGIAVIVLQPDERWLAGPIARGNRIMVLPRDLQRATELLSEIDACDPPLPEGEVRKHLRTHEAKPGG